ncbi:YihY family inner membrane protein [Solirubrobacter pauli]|uniref:YihY family inner membrane protein n=1 Tax=Solirubrobacter pauli TaxID=166793 RepID=A0A660LEX9_9ACTN|nr:YihY/virulence factor BrkB family protein [Solirubrobacter pauli]RKQ93677.1 YihY family inner membrane protein [Solirubrobacter pauli]
MPPAVRRITARALLTLKRACVEFVDDRGHRDAAQIAFFAVLSFVPLSMLLVGGFGLFFEDADIRRRVVLAVFENVPLSQDADRARLESTVGDALDNTGRLGPVSVLLLLVAASGVMGALRHAINQAWDIDTRPPLVRRKALDLALVLGASTVLVFSVSLSATREAADWLGDAGWALDLVGDVLPFAFTVAVVLFLYRVLPSPRPKTREIWPGAVVAALLISVTRGALEIYFEHLADFGALYGSLGALMALLIFVYAVSMILVFGAEYASEWSRLPDGDVTFSTIVGSSKTASRF